MNTILESLPARRVRGIERGAMARAELLRRYVGVRDFSKKICATWNPKIS